MPTFDKEYFSIGYLDTLSYKQTFIHKINPGIKLVVTLAFILTVVSLPKYEIHKLIPFFIFPVFVISAGDIPARVILKKILVVSPFVLFAGMFNPLLDTNIVYRLAGIPVSGGWVSYASIIIKFVLTMSAALLLIATTSFPGICFALEQLRVPKIFVMQLLFIYRYLFVLAGEAMRIVRARNMRAFGRHGRDIKTFINITGTFLLRSMERSGRIYQAICSRGFDGRIRLLRDVGIKLFDIVYALTSVSLFMIFRTYDIVQLLGDFITGVI
jgi:cobalt/nickel transport system permease protein